jgi:hypothetical protein
MEAVSRLGDDELTATVQRLLSQERRVSATLLMHLAEVDTRELYRRHACSSMFAYCVQKLHLSESEAYLRFRAARLGRQFPRVLQMLAFGELYLSAVKLLAPVAGSSSTTNSRTAAVDCQPLPTSACCAGLTTTFWQNATTAVSSCSAGSNAPVLSAAGWTQRLHNEPMMSRRAADA